MSTSVQCNCDGNGWIECWACVDGWAGTTCWDDICVGTTEDGEDCMHGAPPEPCGECKGEGGWACPCRRDAA